MGGDIAKLPEIVDLAEKYGARVMVDDAHGLGVLGENGRGTADYFGLTDKVDIIMGTFSKSLASIGGYMAGDLRVVDYVRHASRPFIFCASIPPASCATALEALHIMKEQPELPKHLLALASHMRKGLRERGIAIRDSITPIIPIYTYTDDRTLIKAKELYEEGVYVNPVLPPATPADECLLRTSYMATHTVELLDEALDIIEKVIGHTAEERENPEA
jgi:7-keto-8-aminopelargonate synthetase-like enzyme